MKTITIDLNNIDAGIREVEQYRDEFEKKCGTLREMIADHICYKAGEGFGRATGNYIIRGSAPVVNDVMVSVTHDNKLSIVIADGPEAVFIEFGAGVYFNGPAGDSPHPWGIENGYGIGTYGQGKGVRNAWNIDAKTVTRGTPAEMPMYRGLEEALRMMDSFVKAVFG